MKTLSEPTHTSLGTVGALVRKGHYLEALRGIQIFSVSANERQFQAVLLAELQLRTGDSDAAVRTATSILRQSTTPPSLVARCHVVLGTRGAGPR